MSPTQVNDNVRRVQEKTGSVLIGKNIEFQVHLQAEML